MHNRIQPKFYRIAEVAILTALSRATIYRMAKDGRFPKIEKIGERASGVSVEKFDQWFHRRAGK